MSVRRIQNFFEEKRKEWYSDDTDLWDEVVYDHEDVAIHNKEERRKYVKECLGQMRDASDTIDELMGEYSTVTGYLADIEEFERLPDSELKHLREVCRGVDNLTGEQEDYENRECRMSDDEYYNIKAREDEVEEGINKIDEAENHRVLIKKDLKRLDNEKSAYRYRQRELMNEQANLKGMVYIVLGALGVCFAILFFLQFGLKFDAKIGFLVAAIAGAAALVFAFVRYNNGARELSGINRGLNRLIQLKNTVKIRYVNNTALLDYLYVKYKVKDSKQLRAMWNRYKEEKEERLRYNRTKAELDGTRKNLARELSKYNLKYPERWLNQTKAIIDSREMVEVRHELISRRHALRKQIDYNKEIAANAKDEVMDIARNYPEYASEIKELIEGYEKI